MATNAAKSEAAAFAAKHDVAASLQDAVNQLARAQPADVNGYLSECLMDKALPATIEKLVGREAVGCGGQPVVQASVHAVIRCKQALLGRECAPSHLFKDANPECAPLRHLPMALVDVASERRSRRGVCAAATAVSNELSAACKGLEVSDQSAVDEALWDADSTDNKTKVGGNAITACSLACLAAGAAARRQPTWQHVQSLHAGGQGRQQPGCQRWLVQLAKPEGKCGVKGILLSVDTNKGVAAASERVASVFCALQTAVAKKCGAAAATPTFGGLLVPCDKAEQLLALCATAVSSTAQDNDPAASLVLHCGAADYFDEGKGKYAMVTGQTKDALELVDDVAAATKAQPLVSAIIDPFAAQHGEAWVALKEALAADASGGSDQSPNLWCMDDVGQGVTLGKDVVSAAVLSLPHAGTVTRMIADSASAKTAGLAVVVRAHEPGLASPTLVDLALGLSPTAVVLGAPAAEGAVGVQRLCDLCDHEQE
eukprot:m.247862 g.247862  ORF g.247862 m.247862 type:complete len:485 (-) comp19071_c0_seq13:64-1518(-)